MDGGPRPFQRELTIEDFENPRGSTVIGSQNDELIVANDDLHPISNVHVFDTVVTFDGGGAYLGMVISAPLDASARSLARFAEKQRFYLESFFSEHGRREWGTPRENKMKIFVEMHPASSAAAFELLKRFEEETNRRGVELRISVSS
jgi:hypothetical protein